MSLQEFSETYLFRHPFAAADRARRYKDLVNWKLLEEILSSPHANCWLPRQGLLPKDEKWATGQLNTAQARAGFNQGRTLLIRHAEKAHSKMAEIGQNFAKLFQDPIDIQLYVTPAEEEGFDWHYDAEEVFVIQTGGEKEFRLRRNTIDPWPLGSKLPRNMEFERERPSPEIRCHLKAGDWLYIPSGYWHKARALTDSFHLSVGVMATTGVSYLKSLLPVIEESPLWRQRIPFHSEEQAQELLCLMKKNLESFLETAKKESLLTAKDSGATVISGPSSL